MFGSMFATTPGPDEIHDIVVLQPKENLLAQILWLVFLLLVLAGLGVALWWWLRGRTRTGSRSPEAVASERFRQLAVAKEHLEPNRFALAVSDTLKDYLSDRFADRVRYETTSEFLARTGTGDSPLPGPAREKLREFLIASDEVKFANPSDADFRTEGLLPLAAEVVKACQPDPKK